MTESSSACWRLVLLLALTGDATTTGRALGRLRGAGGTEAG